MCTCLVAQAKPGAPISAYSHVIDTRTVHDRHLSFCKRSTRQEFTCTAFRAADAEGGIPVLLVSLSNLGHDGAGAEVQVCL